mmetsp:Transcript_17561/g.29044  ORF Transcript_17561/g.29044 Transcript_17561/m.29044 type:complete len:91 (+) Transcript_17561:268-540(+)
MTTAHHHHHHRHNHYHRHFEDVGSKTPPQRRSCSTHNPGGMFRLNRQVTSYATPIISRRDLNVVWKSSLPLLSSSFIRSSSSFFCHSGIN